MNVCMSHVSRHGRNWNGRKKYSLSIFLFLFFRLTFYTCRAHFPVLPSNNNLRVQRFCLCLSSSFLSLSLSCYTWFVYEYYHVCAQAHATLSFLYSKLATDEGESRKKCYYSFRWFVFFFFFFSVFFIGCVCVWLFYSIINRYLSPV